MKRHTPLIAIAASLCCTLAPDDSRAQVMFAGRSLEAAKAEYQRAEESAGAAFAEWLKVHPSGNAGGNQALRDKLRPLVEDAFDARQVLQGAEVSALRSRLDKIERAIMEREKTKDAIVNSRLEALLRSPTAATQPKAVYESRLDENGETATAVRQIPDATARDQIGTPLNPSLPQSAPPGTEARVRYVQEEAVIDGKRKTITRPVIEYVQIQVPLEGADAREPAGPARQTDDRTTSQGKELASSDASFDLDTRERLAQLDLQAAEEEHAAAEKELTRARKLHEQGAVTESAVSTQEKEHRRAALELERAKLKLAGLARQRAELQDGAEAEFAEAQEEVTRAASQVKIAEANAEAARAQLEKMEADAAGAQAHSHHAEKVFKRLKNLAEVQKAIDLRLLDEQEEKLLAAESALGSARATLQTGIANVAQTRAAVAESRAALHIAELRLKAAQDRRDRLRQQMPADALEAQPADSAPSKTDGAGASRQNPITIFLAKNGDSQPALVYLGDGALGEPLEGPATDQDAKIRAAVKDGLADGKAEVSIKAEPGVSHQDVARVAAAARAASTEVKVNLAVQKPE